MSYSADLCQKGQYDNRHKMIWLFTNSSGKFRGSKGVKDDNGGVEGIPGANSWIKHFFQHGGRPTNNRLILEQVWLDLWKSRPLSDFCKTMGSRVFLSVRNLAAKRLKGGNNENQLGFPWIWKELGIEIFFLIELNSNLWYFASTGICDKMLGRDCKERLDIQFIIFL